MPASADTPHTETTDAVAARLRNDLTTAQARVAELGAEYDQAIHDSDMILEDRDTLRALLDSARHRAAAAQRAADSFTNGTYGRCQACGGDIGAERLEALPETTTCISCR